MVSNREPKRPSTGRLIYLCATCVALVYSVYALAVMLSPPAGPPAHNQASGNRLIPLSAEPQATELLGRWVPDEETAARLKTLSNTYAEGSAAPRLSLEKVSYELVDVPYFPKGSTPQMSSTSWRGSWNLYRQGDTWAIYMPHQSVEARGLLYGPRPKYRLRLLVGDPAFNEPLWFVKQ